MRYFRNTSWLLAERVLQIFIGLFVGIWVARYLGPEQFGLYSYLQSFISIFATVATLGMDRIVVRLLVKNNNIANRVVGTAFLLKFTGAVFSLFLLFIIVQFGSNSEYVDKLIYIAASTLIFRSFNIVNIYFQSMVMSKYIVYIRGSSTILAYIIKIVLIIEEASLEAFVWVIAIESIVTASGFVYIFFKKTLFNLSDLSFHKIIGKKLLSDSWPLMLSGAAVGVYMNIDQIMIRSMISDEAVGQYAVAVKLSTIWYFIPGIVITSLFPAIINAKKVSMELYHLRLQRLYNFMVLLAISIALPMTFFSDWIVDMLYGSQYWRSGIVLVIHIWSGIFVFFGMVVNTYLVNENLTKKTLYITLTGSISNIILNALLIPKYGINGAAVATLLGQMISNYIYDFFDKSMHLQLKMKTMGFSPLHIFKIYKDRNI